MNLLDDRLLERSGVVANCRMNRERVLTGSNGYAKELGFHLLDWLKEKAKVAERASWLDLCCGSGKALIEAAQSLRNEGIDAHFEIVGVDLAGMFMPSTAEKCLKLIQSSLTDWRPDHTFDLITCVHGLHYIGDKLDLVSRAASWLSDDGYFAANLDLTSIKYHGGRSANRFVATALRCSGVEYHPRKKLVTCDGKRCVNLPLRYLGADDQAGPNYTGQAAVDSYYIRF